jgi:hypothetical protein
MEWAPFVIIFLLAVPLTANAHEGRQKCTTLYTLIFPPHKKCVILEHHDQTSQNKSNLEYNAGVQAGEKRSLNFNSTDDLKCPSGHTKDFCSGWATTAKYNIQQYQAGKAAGERNSQGINFTSWSCPAGHSKSFCAGWSTTSCSSSGCNVDFTCDQWNDTKGCPHNR